MLDWSTQEHLSDSDSDSDSEEEAQEEVFTTLEAKLAELYRARNPPRTVPCSDPGLDLDDFTPVDVGVDMDEDAAQPAEINKYVKPSVKRYGPWEFSCMKTHIMRSACASPETCGSSAAAGDGGGEICSFCRYENTLVLPSLPEMLFADNYVRVKHDDGFGIEFTALDALRSVDPTHDLMQVAVSQAWKEARADSEHIRDVIKPFDWTFTNDYKGTFTGEKSMKVVPTTDALNLDKLRRREQIVFYDNVHLYEDELADNGCASCSVKIRVMPSGFFILLRFYLRVDNVLIRMNDTRIHHEVGKSYMLRDYCSRESQICDIKLPASMLTDPNEVWEHLAVKEEFVVKLEFPEITI